jgi:hypothetical protein
LEKREKGEETEKEGHCCGAPIIADFQINALLEDDKFVNLTL